MTTMKAADLMPLLLMAAASVAAAGARAQATADPVDLSSYARLPYCTLSKDGARLAVEPCRTAPARNPMPRRPVTEIITPLPRVARAPAAIAPPLPGLRAPSNSRAPQPRIGCGAGSCLDAGGMRHSVAGNVTVTPGGKLCNINGIWMQCS